GDGGGNLLRPAVAQQLAAGAQLVLLVVGAGVVEHPLGHVGFNQTRTDRVDADVPFAQVAGRSHGEVDQAGLGGAVGIAAGAGAYSRHRGRVDDGATVLLLHLPGDVLGEIHRPVQVDLHHFLPDLGVLFGDDGVAVGAAGDAGIVAECVDAAEMRDHVGDAALHRRLIRHVH